MNLWVLNLQVSILRQIWHSDHSWSEISLWNLLKRSFKLYLLAILHWLYHCQLWLSRLLYGQFYSQYDSKVIIYYTQTFVTLATVDSYLFPQIYLVTMRPVQTSHCEFAVVQCDQCDQKKISIKFAQKWFH